jgi:pimeloyl-ACP methyl ester carboxylesterase
VARLGLIAPLLEMARRPGLTGALLTPVLGGLLFPQLLGRRAFLRLYRNLINPVADSAAVDEYFEALRAPSSRAALLASLRSGLDSHTAIADCRRVRAPTLLLWGSEDRLTPPEAGRRLAREIPRSGLELLDAGHAPHEQLPERTAEVLERFLTGQRPGLS